MLRPADPSSPSALRMQLDVEFWERFAMRFTSEAHPGLLRRQAVGVVQHQHKRPAAVLPLVPPRRVLQAWDACHHEQSSLGSSLISRSRSRSD